MIVFDLPKYFDSDKIWILKNLGPKKNWIQGYKTFESTKFWGLGKNLGPEKFWVEKICVQKNLGSRINFGPKNCWSPKILVQKNRGS